MFVQANREQITTRKELQTEVNQDETKIIKLDNWEEEKEESHLPISV